MSIKLIAADMDGTLLSSRKQLPKGFFPLVRTLKKIGVRFAPASGRQYYNLYEQFGEIADELMYISENGGMVCDGRKNRVVRGHAAAAGVRGCGAGAAVCRMCTQSRLCGTARPTRTTIRCSWRTWRCTTHVAKRCLICLKAVQQEPVCKVALFCKNAAETNVLPYYRQMFDDKLQVALSGADWVDLMRLGAEQGRGRGRDVR